MDSILAVCGKEFVAYAIGVDEMDDLTNVTISPAQEEVLGVLSSLIRSSFDQGNSNDPFAIYSSLASINQYRADLDGSFVNFLRTSTGAELPEIGEEGVDQLLVDFLYLARDAWAHYLMPRPKEGPQAFWMSMPIVTFQHPRSFSIATAVLNDPHLGSLFPDSADDARTVESIEELLRYTSLIYMNTGSGGSFQLSSLIGNVLTDAILRTLQLHGVLRWQPFSVQLAETIADLRLLAAKKKVSSKTLVGVFGVQAEGAGTIAIGNGTLRAPLPIERELFLSNAGALTAVLETSTELQLLKVMKHDLTDGHDPVWNWLRPRVEESQRSFQREIDLVRFSLLLASPNDAPWVASESARFIFNLMTPGGIQSWNPSNFGAAESYPVDGSSEQIIQSWHRTLASKHVNSLDVGMRRLLAATTARTDPIDAFVDAVVAWENMFGAQSETTFRVTGAISKLLSDDIGKREILHKELKGLYQKRSQLVHGGKEPSSTEIWELRNRAIAVATDCFRTLYENRPDLLELSSDARGARLLIE